MELENLKKLKAEIISKINSRKDQIKSYEKKTKTLII